MSTNHYNEPRYVGYSKEVMKYYQTDHVDSWTDSKSTSIFAGKMQKDLFIFAMAVGKYYEKKATEVKNKQNNVSVQAMKDNQKWAVLSIGIEEKGDLFCLKDETPIYSEAEKYAHEGIKIIKSNIDEHSINYPLKLEEILRNILEAKHQ